MPEALQKFVIGCACGIVLALALALLFRQALEAFLASARKITLRGPGGLEIRIKGGVANPVVEAILREVEEIMDTLTSEEMALFHRIAQSKGDRSVSDLLPGFRRDTPQHQQLKNLRAAHFVRPAEGGRWQQSKHIEITPFGNLVLQIEGQRLTRRKAS